MTLSRVPIIILIVSGLITPAWPQDEARVDSWRFSDDNGKSESASLWRGDNDWGGDALETFSFECKKHSGTVLVTMVPRDYDLAEIGNLIKNGGSPRFQLLPDASANVVKIEPDDMHGWVMTFEIAMPSKFFSSLTKTGEVRYRLVKAVHNWGIDTGKEVVPKFINACSPK